MEESPLTIKVSYFFPATTNPRAAEKEERTVELCVQPEVQLFVGDVEQRTSVNLRRVKE